MSKQKSNEKKRLQQIKSNWIDGDGALAKFAITYAVDLLWR